MHNLRQFSKGYFLVFVTTVSATLAMTSHSAPITYFSFSHSIGQTGNTPFPPVVGGPDNNQSLDASGGFVSTSATFGDAMGDASAQGSADLSQGQLKAMADVSQTNQQGSVNGFQRSDIGDSFRTYQGNTPFNWGGSQASFSIDVTGSVNLDGAINDSEVLMLIFQPGALDYYARWLNGEDTFGQWITQIISSSFTTINGNASLPFNITPGMDFDWALGLIASTRINGLSPGTRSGTADFFNTVNLSYTGPAGTNTYSASGLFPDTLDLADAPSVPEPSSVLLLSLGLLGLTLYTRKRIFVAV